MECVSEHAGRGNLSHRANRQLTSLEKLRARYQSLNPEFPTHELCDFCQVPSPGPRFHHL